MSFLKKYWYLVILTLVTVALGVATFLITQKLKQEAPVAPTVPQEEPKAVAPACTLTFAISIPTTTPTETPTPTPTSTPTPTPTPTPTSAPNTDPTCTGMSASPASGDAPLEVTFTCSGVDPDGDITAAEFNFGNGETRLVEKNVGSPGSLSTTYSYSQTGNFGASCRVRDNNFKFSGIPDGCKKTISVGGAGAQVTTPTPTTPRQIVEGPTPTPTAAPTPKVPVSGVGPTVLGAAAIGGGLLLLLLGLAL